MLALLLIFLLVQVLMLAYGANALVLVFAHLRGRQQRPSPGVAPAELPRVTVQLAVYNEENVIGRLLDAAAALRWPKDRLEIQLLDDSTDRTGELARPHIEAMQRAGLRVKHLRRRQRDGYKAGALQRGLEEAEGELIALFDADFVPPPDFLIEALPWFEDPKIAAVQGRWTHLNRGASWLTVAQAVAIDGHFGVEQGARSAAGWFLNFNGTAGIWRKAAIEDAGGWSADTLTEDLDLSYRAQLRGWRLVYDSELRCPAELPTQLAAFKAQQRRWATGSIQTARKLLPSVWRSDASWMAKLQASLHLTHYSAHPLMVVAAFLSVPCVAWTASSLGLPAMLPVLSLFLFSMLGPMTLHLYAQWRLERRLLRPGELLSLSLLGIGIALSISAAVLQGLRGGSREFVRTPKLGGVGGDEAPLHAYRAPSDHMAGAEALMALYCLGAGLVLGSVGLWGLAPFLLLYAAGFGVVAARGVAEASL